MLKKIVVIILTIILVILLVSFLIKIFYLEPLIAGIKPEFIKEKKEIVISLKYPLPKNYFLKKFKIIPSLEGSFVFEDGFKPPFHILGFRKVRFEPYKIKKETVYKIKCFEKEFSFSLPFPKPKELIFDETKKEIIILFFEPIEKEDFLEKFKTEPKLAGNYSFSEGGVRVVFVPEKIELDKDYKIEFLDKNLSFKIESPKVKEINFNKEKKEIIIDFTKSIESEYFFQNFKIEPYLEGRFVFNTPSQVIFQPNKIEKGKDYKIKILEREFNFKIELPPLPVQIQPFQSLPLPKTSPIQLASGEELIEIDLSEQILRLHQEKMIIKEYKISSGKKGMRTPRGNFQVLSKRKLVWSRTYGLYMPFALRFHNGYFIHELPYWPGGYREGEAHLGIPVSAGCVRLGIGAAEEVYNFAEIGTKIAIHE